MNLMYKWGTYVVIAYVGVSTALVGLYQVNREAKDLARTNETRALRTCERLAAIAHAVEDISPGSQLTFTLDRIDDKYSDVKRCKR